MLTLNPTPTAKYYVAMVDKVIPYWLLLRVFHFVSISRVPTTHPGYRATILSGLHGDGYDVPCQIIDAIRAEFSVLDTDEKLALKALKGKCMSERYDKIPWVGPRMYLDSITPRLTVAGKVVMTALELGANPIPAVGFGLDAIPGSYGSAEYPRHFAEVARRSPSSLVSSTSDGGECIPEASIRFKENSMNCMLDGDVTESPRSFASLADEPLLPRSETSLSLGTSDTTSSLSSSKSTSALFKQWMWLGQNGSDEVDRERGPYEQLTSAESSPISSISSRVRNIIRKKSSTTPQPVEGTKNDSNGRRNLVWLYRHGKTKLQIRNILGLKVSEEELDSLFVDALQQELSRMEARNMV